MTHGGHLALEKRQLLALAEVVDGIADVSFP
jgi:hypothetical protein